MDCFSCVPLLQFPVGYKEGVDTSFVRTLCRIIITIKHLAYTKAQPGTMPWMSFMTPQTCWGPLGKIRQLLGMALALPNRLHSLPLHHTKPKLKLHCSMLHRAATFPSTKLLWLSVREKGNLCYLHHISMQSLQLGISWEVADDLIPSRCKGQFHQ